MKRILIPTDFSIESLKMVKAISNQLNNHRYELILLHGIHLPESIIDYLFYSKPKLIQSLTNPWFEEACSLLRNKFSSTVHSIRKDVFTGYSQYAFNCYLHINKIDEAYIPASYSLNAISDKSFDLIPFIRKSSVKINEVEWNVKQTSDNSNFSEIFFS